ncbi:hypothetical protein Daus18300_012421 [Diaporthe australafricana]|uniref:Uncharacterized protein n=1 Tax=Diaporthe australafricana TaxID=127596 RepID=A0ABR3W2T0_9PEZI
MSTNAIPLETLASSARLRRTATSNINPDTATDALHSGSAPLPDAHPPDNVNPTQSSQEVVRVPSSLLHREARESAGSQPAPIPSHRTHWWRRHDTDDYWVSVGWAEEQCIAHRHH